MVDPLKVLQNSDILRTVHAHFCSSGFVKDLAKFTFVAFLSAFAAMRRLEVHAKLFGNLLVSRWLPSRLGRVEMQIWTIMFVELANVACDAGLAFLTFALAIPLQDQLTKALQNTYMSGLTYYHARELTPHEFVAKDVPAFSQELVDATCGVLSAMVRLSLFGFRLTSLAVLAPLSWRWSLTCAIPAWMVSVLLSRLQKGRAMACQRQQRNLEASVRRHHDRIRRHAEAIATCGGGSTEAHSLSQRLNILQQQGLRTLKASFFSEVGKEFAVRYSQHALLISLTWQALPAADKAQSRDGFEAVESIVESLRLLWDVVAAQLQAAFHMIRISESAQPLLANAVRLGHFCIELRHRRSWQRTWDRSTAMTDTSSCIRFNDVTVSNPTSGRVLIERLNVRVGRAEHLLISGPLGSGKTALARVMGSLWPLKHGSLALPGGHALGLARAGLVYLPERPLLGRGRRLKDQLALPCFPGAGSPSSEFERVEVNRLLQLIGLSNRADSSNLSLAETQRMGIAQLLYYRPTFAFLDECTSALPPSEESQLLEACCQAGITLISTSAGPHLRGRIFQQVLRLQGDGSWKIQKFNNKNSSLPNQREDDRIKVESTAHDEGQESLAVGGAPWAVHYKLACWALRHSPKKVGLAVGVMIVTGGLGVLRAVAAHGLVLESVAILRHALAVGSPILGETHSGDDGTEVLKCIVVSVCRGLLQATSSAALSQISSAADLICRRRFSDALLRHLLCHGQGRIYCLVSQHFPEGLDRVLFDDVHVLFASVWRLIADFSRRLGDMVVYGHALWRLSKMVGFGKRLSPSSCSRTSTVLLLAMTITELHSFIASCHSRQVPEGAFLAAHARFRRDSERIAMAHAEEQERRVIDDALESRRVAQRRHRFREVFTGFLTQASCKLFVQHMVWSICWSYCSKAGSTFSLGESVYVLRYLSLIVQPLVAALFSGWSDLVTKWRLTFAPAGRIYQVIRLLHDHSSEERKNGDAIGAELSNVILEASQRFSHYPKAKQNRLQKLSLSIDDRSGHLLICGPVGAGKSVVARALCGLYPLAGGVVRPLKSGSVMYLTSWPHLAGISLADHIMYPVKAEEPVSSEVVARLQMALSLAVADHLLPYLTSHLRQVSEQWMDSLSLDNRQRLAFARVFWRQPRFLVVHGCTSAMPATVEAQVFSNCQEKGIVLIIASRFHSLEVDPGQILELDGSGGWELQARRPAVLDNSINESKRLQNKADV